MAEQIHYQVRWRASGVRPGAHVGRMTGSGSLFRGHGSLIDFPDPRRIDVRATARDPYQRTLVKIYQQNASIPVWIVADWSASMGFHGQIDKRAQVVDVAKQLAWSTWRMGDRLGFIACDDQVRKDMIVPLRCSRDIGLEVDRLLDRLPSADIGANGLKNAASLMGRERALVFLLSDFHFSSAALKTILTSLAHHDVVPVVLWDQAEFQDMPSWGLGRVKDAESGQEQLLWFRPSLKRSIQQKYDERLHEIESLCRGLSRPPFLVTSRFEASKMSRYFMEPTI